MDVVPAMGNEDGELDSLVGELPVTEQGTFSNLLSTVRVALTVRYRTDAFFAESLVVVTVAENSAVSVPDFREVQGRMRLDTDYFVSESDVDSGREATSVYCFSLVRSWDDCRQSLWIDSYEGDWMNW